MKLLDDQIGKRAARLTAPVAIALAIFAFEVLVTPIPVLSWLTFPWMAVMFLLSPYMALINTVLLLRNVRQQGWKRSRTNLLGILVAVVTFPPVIAAALVATGLFRIG